MPSLSAIKASAAPKMIAVGKKPLNAALSAVIPVPSADVSVIVAVKDDEKIAIVALDIPSTALKAAVPILAATNAPASRPKCFPAVTIYPAHSTIVALFSLMKFEKEAMPEVSISNIGLVSSLLSSVSSFFSDPKATS